MLRRGRNGVNLDMVPPWGGGSSSRGRIHGGNALSGRSGGCRSRQGGGHGGGCSGGWNCSGDEDRACNGAAGRGRRRAAHPRLVAMTFMGLRHGWAREREEVERKTSKHGNEDLK